MKRGAIQKRKARLVSLWIPKDMDKAIVDVVEAEDSDKSKFIRAAIREKVRRLGVPPPAPDPS